jgi:putative chitinase
LARKSAFIAQIAHESGQFNYVTEIASGSAYEGRKDLGNTIVGDGVKFKGRGLIQITGRANYGLCSTALTGSSHTFIDNPELLATPLYACLSAGWYWNSRGLNTLADMGDFMGITKRINGGTNGLASRLEFWERAKKSIK